MIELEDEELIESVRKEPIKHDIDKLFDDFNEPENYGMGSK